MRETNNAYGKLVRESLGKWPLARPRKRWKDSIMMDRS